MTFFWLIFSPLAGPSFVSLHFISSSLNPAIMGGLQKVHLYRRKWPATANWLEFSAPRFIEVMDLFCCLVCSSTPTLILKHWKIDLSHMTSVTEQNLIVGYQKIFSLFWLWIFVTMTGHRTHIVSSDDNKRVSLVGYDLWNIYFQICIRWTSCVIVL